MNSNAWRRSGRWWVAGAGALLALVAGAAPTWKPHRVKQADGHGGWVEHPAEARLIQHQDSGRYLFPFGVRQLDNGQVILAASWNDGSSTNGRKAEKPVIAFSPDRGDTWSTFTTVPGAIGRPVMLTDLGKGRLAFQTDPMGSFLSIQYFSADYGRTWPESKELQAAANGGTRPDGETVPGFFGVEGNALVDYDAAGRVTQVAQIGWNFEKGKPWPAASSAGGILRWSRDGGRTWTNETIPNAWTFQAPHGDRMETRGVSEGSLVRAANGWLVAAVRADMPPRFVDGPNDDSLEGTAVSISKDDGKTWSPAQVLFEAGRHHADLLRLPNGDLLMTLIVRNDVAPGELRNASSRRGCEAVLSRDNGLTWDVEHRYIVDSFDYLDPEHWFDGKCGHLSSCLLDDGSVLTVYGNYVKAGAVMVRWRPGDLVH